MKFPLAILQKCWFLAGPTAVGKTATGLALATRQNAEILSLDSMAIYRGMDIGTAKPSSHDQQFVRHHLIDIVDPHEEFSTAQYFDRALQAAAEIHARGKTPLFVGGTGLYLRAILRGVFEGPPADWEFRAQTEARAQSQSPGWLHQQLTRVDPDTARKLHPHDVRRIVRALEIAHVTGQPPSVLRQEQPLPEADRPPHVFWLHPPRDWLYSRIDERVDAMFDAGLVSEVESLLQRDPPLGRTARQALGYREIIDWQERRIVSEQAARELIKTRTRQFAKRQHTWFRNLEECRAVELEPHRSLDELIERILDNAS